MALPELLTVPEVAARLQVTPDTVYVWIGERRFPVIRLGRLVRIAAPDLERFLESRTEAAGPRPVRPLAAASERLRLRALGRRVP